jgi:hypothetical protein
LKIITDCNLTVEAGGEISHNDKDGGKKIEITVGKNLIVDGSIEAKSQSNNRKKRNGGNILINAGGDMNIGATGMIKADGGKDGGQVTIKSKGSLLLADQGEITSNSSDGKSGANGGAVAFEIGQDLSVYGLIQANGQNDNGGIIMASVNGEVTVGSTGTIDAQAYDGTGENDHGGKIAIKAAGELNMAGELNAYGIRNGGEIDLWSAADIDISGNVLAKGKENGRLEKNGGHIYVVSRQNLNFSGAMDTTAKSNDGEIRLFYNTFNTNSGQTYPAPIEETITPTTNEIIMNEFVPHSANDHGTNGGGLDGQWVELYNLSNVPVDINGWYLYDDDPAHSGLIINAARCSGGSTVISAHGLLSVFREGAPNSNFALKHGQDIVKLYNGIKNSGGISLQDAFAYIFDLGADKSYARIPDGNGPWYDPDPTPDEPNKVDETNDYSWLYEQIAGDTDTEEPDPVDLPDDMASELPSVASTTITDILDGQATTTEESGTETSGSNSQDTGESAASIEETPGGVTASTTEPIEQGTDAPDMASGTPDADQPEPEANEHSNANDSPNDSPVVDKNIIDENASTIETAPEPGESLPASEPEVLPADSAEPAIVPEEPSARAVENDAPFRENNRVREIIDRLPPAVDPVSALITALIPTLVTVTD